MPPHAISIRISLFFNSTCHKFDIIVMKWNFYFHLLNERMSRSVLLFVCMYAASDGVEYLKWFAIGVWYDWNSKLKMCRNGKCENWMNSAECTMIKCKILMNFFGEKKNCNASNGTFKEKILTKLPELLLFSVQYSQYSILSEKNSNKPNIRSVFWLNGFNSEQSQL